MSLRTMFIIYATVLGFTAAAIMIGAIKLWDVYSANRKWHQQAKFIKSNYDTIHRQQMQRLNEKMRRPQ